MKLLHDRIVALCRDKGMSVSDALARAGVSRNAYYSLARSRSVLPASIDALADALDVRPAEFLEETPSVKDEAYALVAEVDRIAKKHRGIDRDNVRHTLLLLREKPVSRLRRALRRGQRFNIRT